MASTKAMAHNFALTPKAHIPRSEFPRDSTMKLTCDSGYLVPIFVDEALPGDTFRLDGNIFARLATPVVPVMDDIYLETFFFAVPYRLVWDNFQRFMGEQKNPGDSTDFLCPQVIAPEGGFGFGSLSDYFGIAPNVSGIAVDAFWHRAYNLIYNEWVRDENLIDSVDVPTDDGPDDPSIYQLRKRRKYKDYFTGCLPWPQKGEEVLLPLFGNVPVTGLYVNNATADATPADFYGVDGSGEGHPTFAVNSLTGNTTRLRIQAVSEGASSADNYPVLNADLGETRSTTINQLRQAVAVQKLAEAYARSGSRYTEIIRGLFGIVSPDARLQRPELLGGHSSRIYFSSVPQTSASDAVTPQGNLAAYAFGASDKHGFTKSFTEHTLILGLMNIRCNLTYQQGIPRMFSRRTKDDFYWPLYNGLGEQAVLNKEIYAQGNYQDDEVFGYQERFAEYRYKNSLICGAFRSDHPQSLDVWHLSQKFTELPKLNQAFVEENPPIDRIIAVQDEPQFLVDIDWKLHCVRPMPVYSIPGMNVHL